LRYTVFERRLDYARDVTPDVFSPAPSVTISTWRRANADERGVVRVRLDE
jgi:hypothetical protein